MTHASDITRLHKHQCLPNIFIAFRSSRRRSVTSLLVHSSEIYLKFAYCTKFTTSHQHLKIILPLSFLRTTYEEPEMTDSSLPFETVEAIIEDFLLEYKVTGQESARSIRFLPRWYLVPLLRVCKLWHAVAERFLYRSISVGSRFPGARVRQAYKIPRRLVTTLAANSRLAALVEELRLGIEDVTDRKSLDWTRRNIRILRICPNVKHVEIRGFNVSLQDALTDVLKEKSLISFHITTQFLSGGRSYDIHSLKLFELMRRWPNLQSIIINGLKCITELDDLDGVKTPDLPFRCPDLRNIVTTGDLDCGKIEFLRYLRGISGSIKFLDFPYVKSETELQTLCECLRSWSSTLDRLCLSMNIQDFSYLPLWEALSNLRSLRELRIYGWNLDIKFGSIATLPRLERLIFSPFSINQHERLIFIRYLEDKEKFPALKYLRTSTLGWRRDVPEQMKRVLLNREIQVD